MKKILIIAGLMLVPFALLAASQVQPGLGNFIEKFNLNATRPCLYPPGGATTIDSDNSGANNSAALNAWSRYEFQCDDTETYWAVGTSAAAADSGDLWIARGTVKTFITDATSVVLSVLNVSSATADCHYIECR